MFKQNFLLPMLVVGLVFACGTTGGVQVGGAVDVPGVSGGVAGGVSWGPKPAPVPIGPSFDTLELALAQVDSLIESEAAPGVAYWTQKKQDIEGAKTEINPGWNDPPRESGDPT